MCQSFCHNVNWKKVPTDEQSTKEISVTGSGNNVHNIYKWRPWCSLPSSVKPVNSFTWIRQQVPLYLASLAVTCLWQLSKSIRRSNNQCRLFVPSCWVNQRRSHSAPWVLTQTRSPFLPTGHFYSYLSCDAYLYSWVINNHSLFLLVTFFLELYLRTRQCNFQVQVDLSIYHSQLHRDMYHCRQNRLSLTHALLGLHFHHHYRPCTERFCDARTQCIFFSEPKQNYLSRSTK